MVCKCGPDLVAFHSRLCVVAFMLYPPVEFLEQVFLKILVSSY